VLGNQVIFILAAAAAQLAAANRATLKIAAKMMIAPERGAAISAGFVSVAMGEFRRFFPEGYPSNVNLFRLVEPAPCKRRFEVLSDDFLPDLLPCEARRPSLCRQRDYVPVEVHLNTRGAP